MPSTRPVDRPQEALAIARRYLRRERPLSALVVVLAVVVFLGTFVATSLVPVVVLGTLLIVVARAPIIESRGTVCLRTDADAESVVESLAGPTPPVPVFQRGIAKRYRDEALEAQGYVLIGRDEQYGVAIRTVPDQLYCQTYVGKDRSGDI